MKFFFFLFLFFGGLLVPLRLNVLYCFFVFSLLFIALVIAKTNEDFGLGGLIVNSTQGIPKLNQEIRLGNFLFKILEVTNTRINLVSLKIDA